MSHVADVKLFRSGNMSQNDLNSNHANKTLCRWCAQWPTRTDSSEIIYSYTATENPQDRMRINCQLPALRSRPTSWRHRRHRTMRLAPPRRHLPLIKACSHTIMHDSPTRQSRRLNDKDASPVEHLCVFSAEESEEWQWSPPWHHQDSDPSSQLSDGNARTLVKLLHR